MSGTYYITQPPLKPTEASCETRQHVARKRAMPEQSLKRRLDQAVKGGELPKGVSATNLARYYSVLIQGLALQAQHGGAPEELMHVVDVAMESWPGNK